MKIVLDTNVLVSALFWNGNESQALETVEQGLHENHISRELIQELENVIATKFPDAPTQSWKEFLAKIREHSTHIPLERVGREDDRHVIALAQRAHADRIVTGDKALRRRSPVPAISAKRLIQKP